ncbi:DUF6270 domain-containing protein [Brachybacterium tyrofermentans]|uniref:DUF6270 domain-containing protein n=1 Tax=Brachybacterium tyrofermentans TaxID=47848 RepID=UPI003FD533F6
MRNIQIYGSCVSRDAFAPVPPSYNLVGYVARQSLISALSKPTNLLNGDELQSPFQNRMLTGNLSSNALVAIRKSAKNLTLLIMDLTDERLGVHRLPDGSFVTRSTELVNSGRLRNLERKPIHLQFGTDTHMRFWTLAAKRFFRRLDSLGLRDRTLVLNTPWANMSAESVAVPELPRIPNALADRTFAEMANVVRGCGYTVADMPFELAVTTTEHKWQMSPFHYTEPAMQWIRDTASDVIADLAEPSQ